MVAFAGGQVLGFCLVGLALSILEILILAYKPSIMYFIYDLIELQISFSIHIAGCTKFARQGTSDL